MIPPLPPQIKDAATVVLVRRDGPEPRVLMGQRGHGAVFMPGKFVFPGGAVDAEDFSADVAGALAPTCAARLNVEAPPDLARALPVAALRELREETGLVIESISALSFVFRAITPPGRPRRFDARFFLADAAHVSGALDDFSQAEDELSHIGWVSLSVARGYDLPFVTRVVLAEVEGLLAGALPPPHVSFFDHRGDVGAVRAIG